MTERTFLDDFTAQSEWAARMIDAHHSRATRQNDTAKQAKAAKRKKLQSFVLSRWTPETNPPIPRLITSHCTTGIE